ncbi:MAG: hypothetical protein WBC93_00540 [Sulfitobacter sp.]
MRILFVLAMMSLLGACAVDSGPEAAPEVLASKAYRSPTVPSLTFYTMISNRTGSGGHTSMMINGSQRVIFDPAGSFRHSSVPEKGDVLYGITPGVERSYRSAHARDTYHVVIQEIQVTPAQAERALQLAQQNGRVPGVYCTNATSTMLRQVPGFEDIQVTFYPRNLMDQISKRPGVKTEKYYENDAGDVVDGLAALGL